MCDIRTPYPLLPSHPVSIFPELGCHLGGGEAGDSWSRFRALNPEGGGPASANDGQEFLRTIQVLIAVVVMVGDDGGGDTFSPLLHLSS